jgi:hypothetical protein
MMKIKRTSQLVARDVPYIMHPKKAILTLRQRFGVSDHHDFASSHRHEQFKTHSSEFPFVRSSDIEEGRITILQSESQHYAVDSKGTVRSFLPSVLEFKVRHLLGQPRKENIHQEQAYFAEVKALLEDPFPMPLETAKVVEKPKAAQTPTGFVNQYPNGRNASDIDFITEPTLTASQSAQVDELHAWLLSTNINGITKPEVAEYITTRDSLTERVALLESGDWYRGKVHDVLDKKREIADLDYEFARRADQVGLVTVTPILDLAGLGIGSLAKAGISSTIKLGSKKGVSIGTNSTKGTTTIGRESFVPDSNVLNTGGRVIPKWKWGNNPITDAQAAEAYQAIAASKTDVAAIARYMNLNERSVERLYKIKDYLFKGNNDIPGFTPDPAIATAWNRMRSGGSDLAARQRDMTLLKHEVAEMRIKQQNPGINHTEAHRLANERYNWQETVPWEELGF